MLATQITGLFRGIHEKEEFQIEDVARSLSQAVVGDGRIYVKGFGEMVAIESEVQSGPEPLPKQHVYDPSVSLSHLDRVIVASRFADDENALSFIKDVQEQGAEAILIAAETKEDNPAKEQADFFINTRAKGPLLPFEMERVGFPSTIAMLYVHHALFVTVKEITDEYDID
ncbi:MULTISPECIES: DUF2529 family protein [Pontibacillus]|uniref:DUF2529 family protein n=1 Tax=Pontibacillus chungwhensis TaxID=265426 RepID=A0ABY8V388_9BACI|nr:MULTISPECIES: DUF2529 family protein [Pontibacillus]MCD5324036.1 DUF2529 domain-containing protein [Pontibacillus sp. HN14]WIG00268.1 DUF2529 family protein [Pontibacillus chungwhensis]